MAWRGAASRSLLAAVRGRAASSSAGTSRLRAAAPLPAASRRRVPAFAFATARPLAAMAGSPAAAVARLTGHTVVSVRACCELSQGTLFCRTCRIASKPKWERRLMRRPDRMIGIPFHKMMYLIRTFVLQCKTTQFFGGCIFWKLIQLASFFLRSAEFVVLARVSSRPMDVILATNFYI